ncbi:MAG: isochorismatase family protein [Armatimonadetes bacterium]|nr:isochorismatase family protein [Armatimonadota bacterium]
MRLHAEECLLIVVDMQPSFLGGIVGADEVMKRTKFLVECANLLEVPTLATVQYPERMGGTEESLHAMIQGETLDKMAFSCCGASGLMEAVEKSERGTIVLVGIETHICVTQTALDLLEEGYEVAIVLDAVSSRSEQANKIGTKRLRDAGAQVVHSESVVYEWMESADHPKFRDVLKVVKAYSGS